MLTRMKSWLVDHGITASAEARPMPDNLYLRQYALAARAFSDRLVKGKSATGWG